MFNLSISNPKRSFTAVPAVKIQIVEMKMRIISKNEKWGISKKNPINAVKEHAKPFQGRLTSIKLNNLFFPIILEKNFSILPSLLSQVRIYKYTYILMVVRRN